MKKILVSIFAVFYLTSTVGATLHLYYCMDKVVNWSFFKADGDKCDKCGMNKDGGCCKDEQKFIKNSVDQKATGSSIDVLQPLKVIALTPFFNKLEFHTSLIKEYPVGHAPPNSDVGIHILNCVFRI